MSNLVTLQGKQMSVDQVQILRTQICPTLNESEFQLFMYVCSRTGLDPLMKQIHAVKRKNYNPTTGKTSYSVSFQTSIDGFRLIAQRSGKYKGQNGPWWCGEDGVWRDVWLLPTPPVAAKVEVETDGATKPVVGVALWSEFCVTTGKDKNGNPVLGPMWRKMPSHMIAKVAEAIALRKAFPLELSNIYSDDEMEQAGQTIEKDADIPPSRPLPYDKNAAVNSNHWKVFTTFLKDNGFPFELVDSYIKLKYGVSFNLLNMGQYLDLFDGLKKMSVDELAIEVTFMKTENEVNNAELVKDDGKETELPADTKASGCN